jgi:filamentous hemagglutinin
MMFSSRIAWRRVAALALLVASLLGVTVARAASSDDAAQIARKIAAGHAYDKHVVAEGQFPGIASRAAFAALIEGIIEHPSASRALASDRMAWWDEASGAVVIANPHDRDGGTCFKPRAGRPYFDHLH